MDSLFDASIAQEKTQGRDKRKVRERVRVRTRTRAETSEVSERGPGQWSMSLSHSGLMDRS